MSAAWIAPTNAAPVTVRAADRVARLEAEAADAARVRALTTHPDVIAMRVERVRTQVDALLWAGIVLGLAFTMVNVQSFAAAGSTPDRLAWWVAWLLDPMVSLVLLAVLRAEQVTARYQVALPAWGRRTKWLTFAATYVMNTWTSWGLGGLDTGTGLAPISWSGVVLHSVPPLVVFATAETGPGLRDRLTEAVHRALTTTPPVTTTRPVTTTATVAATAEQVHEPAAVPVREALAASVHEPAPASRRPAAKSATGTRRRARKSTPRTSFADYLSTALVALATAQNDGQDIDPSPSWCRQVTGCSAGTSVKLAAALRGTDGSTADSATGSTADGTADGVHDGSADHSTPSTTPSDVSSRLDRQEAA